MYTGQRIQHLQEYAIIVICLFYVCNSVSITYFHPKNPLFHPSILCGGAPCSIHVYIYNSTKEDDEKSIVIDELKLTHFVAGLTL